MSVTKKEEFFNTTLPYNSFNIVITNTDGSCCYNSVYKLLLSHNLITDKITTEDIQQLAVDWIDKYRNLYLYNVNMTVEEYVLFNHNLDSIETYLEYYSIYSGNSDDEDILIERWGGIRINRIK